MCSRQFEGYENNIFFRKQNLHYSCGFDSNTNWDAANAWLDGAELHLVVREVPGYFHTPFDSRIGERQPSKKTRP